MPTRHSIHWAWIILALCFFNLFVNYSVCLGYGVILTEMIRELAFSRTALRIFKLIEAVMRDPFQGIGKPKPLKFLGPGVWSRRITQEHRLVYVVGHNRIDFAQGRYHDPNRHY